LCGCETAGRLGAVICSLVPNLLSALRIALMPAVLLTAVGGSKPWFVGLLVAALLTDAFDGYLARRLHAQSELGRKLDSLADYLVMITGIAGIALLWPDIMRRELAWVATGLGAFFAVVIYGFVRLGRAPCYHTWASKILAVVCGPTLIPLLAEWSAVPFHGVMTLLVLCGAEEILIAALVPWHVGEMPTVWHAWRLRRTARR
jgi:phosphatidylglycerophosphate synthase